MPDRAILFVDGNNLYHCLKNMGVKDLGRLNYAELSRRLVKGRTWIETRYYVGRLRASSKDYSSQQRFLANLEKQDARISCHLGRIEPRTAKNELAVELLEYLNGLDTRIDEKVYHELLHMAARNKEAKIYVEKATDVGIAVDLVSMALTDEYDTAYLLSADGDFTPAVQKAKGVGKKVFAVTGGSAAQLSKVCDTVIPLKRKDFSDSLYLDS